jgi:hypothetical protein
MIGALDDRVHVPGPRRGTTATANARLSAPVTTPLETLTLGACAGDLTIELVATAKCVSLVIVVVVERTTDVVVVGAVLVVEPTTAGVVVVVGLVEETVEGSCTITRRVEGLDVAVSVNSRTRSSRGLDHITRWALRSEKCLRATAIRR